MILPLFRPAALSLFLALPLALPSTTPQGESPPPSMVFIKGGNTWVGTDKKEIEQIMIDSEAARGAARTLDAETPLHRVNVDDFYIMVTEVTNEQYREFVRATQHRPPFTWGRKPLDVARLAFLEAEHKTFQSEKSQGKRYEKKKFDDEAWWSKNWQEVEWEMPPELAMKPVTHVDYGDAVEYTRWAGLRLPLEFEYQRAVRGDSKRTYPWGDEWEAGKYCATNEIKGINSVFDAASFMDGATEAGVLDLAGNAWEWTDSPYVAYKGFKPGTFVFKKSGGRREKIEPEPKWDPNQRVVVGGCFQASKMAARVSVRRASDRTQMTNALGFRCAATPRSCVDIATSIELVDVRNSDARPDQMTYVPNQVVGLDTWSTIAPSSDKAPPGYGVISGYDYMIFVPNEKLAQQEKVVFDRDSLVAPIHLGFLSTDQTILDPELQPGTYLVAYRAPGKPPRKKEEKGEGDEGEEAEVVEEPATALESMIDTTKTNLLFFDTKSGELVKAIEPRGDALQFQKPKDAGGVTLEDRVAWENVDGEEVKKMEKWFVFSINIASSNSKRVLTLELPLKPEPEAAAKSWRLPQG